MAKILIIRLSAIGDVALTIPVVYSAAKANPDDHFTILTNAFLLPIFINRPINVNIVGINTKGTEHSLGGLLRFAKAYAQYDFNIVLDLHNVLRTKLIRLLFRIYGKKVFVINKSYRQRRKLTRAKNKVLTPIRHVIDRYADTIIAAGLNYADTFDSLIPPDYSPTGLDILPKPNGIKWIGIAPFAKHKGKIYPLEKMEEVVRSLSSTANVEIYLFGGGKDELSTLKTWAERYPHTHNVAGKYSLNNELCLISQMDLLICMDSANMHFASLVKAPILPIWGATHPFCGFFGYRQSPANAIQEDLPCRPCSIYGDKPCRTKDWACMQKIPPERIVTEALKRTFNK
ncbi:MAG: glycosyltransferase family 9 protein [Tannerellaceae bacterium]|jgi:ADP-heptose:LPS heptosyltransferase|nr:glycosyltransferase family 9 protein [Tannerellaceae bacterium]